MGLPIRKTGTPLSTNFSDIQSTAILLCAHTITWFSLCKVSKTASTKVVVFPVPGGPCTTNMSLAANTLLTAASCDVFNQGNRIGKSSLVCAG